MFWNKISKSNTYGAAATVPAAPRITLSPTTPTADATDLTPEPTIWTADLYDGAHEQLR